MGHKHFTKKSKNFYKVKILTTIEFNNGSCSVSELEGYSRKELKISRPGLNPYITILINGISHYTIAYIKLKLKLKIYFFIYIL